MVPNAIKATILNFVKALYKRCWENANLSFTLPFKPVWVHCQKKKKNQGKDFRCQLSYSDIHTQTLKNRISNRL